MGGIRSRGRLAGGLMVFVGVLSLIGEQAIGLNLLYLGSYDTSLRQPVFGKYDLGIQVPTWDPEFTSFSCYPFMASDPNGLLVAGDGSQLYQVDPLYRTKTLIGTLRYEGTPISCSGLTFRPDGRLYIHEYSNRTGAWKHHLFLLDPATGSMTLIGEITGENFTGLYGIAYLNGILYGAYDHALYAINPETAVATLLSTSVSAWDLGAGLDGVLYGAMPGIGTASSAGVFSIHPTNYTVTPIQDFQVTENKEVWGIAPRISPRPKLIALPEFTQGTTCTVTWQGTWEATAYCLEWDTSETFDSPVGTSGWITGTSYTATNLIDAQRYYYRVKARNTDGTETFWSDAVSSTPDSVPPTGSVLINNGDESTRELSVNLDLFATDTASGVASVRTSNNGVNWTVWEDYYGLSFQTIPANSPDGIQTMYVQYKDAVGNVSDIFSDTIFFDQANPVILTVTPDRGTTVGYLSSISVTFTQPVIGVTAGTLTVNGSAATSVTGSGAGPYTFTGYSVPGNGTVTVALRAGTICDEAGNPFAGDTWTLTVMGISQISGTVEIFGSTGSNPHLIGEVRADNGGGTVPVNNGAFQIAVLSGWTGTLTLVKSGWYTFPSALHYYGVTGNITGAKFVISPQHIPGDIDGNNAIDYTDFVTVKLNFGQSSGAGWADGDFDGDGAVTYSDFLTCKVNFGKVGVQVGGIVTLQNFGGDNTGMGVIIELWDPNQPGSTVPVSRCLVPLDAIGHYSFPTELHGTYSISAKVSPHWVRKKLTNTIDTNTNIEGVNFELVNGDINGDNVIDASDLTILNDPSNMNKQWPNDPPANPNTDLNGDGQVNSMDLGILTSLTMPLQGD